jgi:hypothetical protein
MNCGHAADPVMVANRQRHAHLPFRQEETVEETLSEVMTAEAA